MHSNYQDILDRIPEAPAWYDQNGCPRYAPFASHLCPDIYSRVVVLARIGCQACHKEFTVEMHAGIFDTRHERPPKSWHYGDPPRHGCVGDTMNCDDLAILEVWQQVDFAEWRRRPEFEGLVAADAGNA